MSGLNYYYFKIWTDNMYILIELLILFISDVITMDFDLYLPFSIYLSIYLYIYHLSICIYAFTYFSVSVYLLSFLLLG